MAANTLSPPAPENAIKAGIARVSAGSSLPWDRFLPTLLLVSLTLAGSACSNRAIYENIQQNQLRACEELPIPQQAQCKAQYRTSYEEYRRERDRIGDN